MTYGEAYDWYKAQAETLNTQMRSENLRVWQSGLMNRFAIVSALSDGFQYPTFEEMFPSKDKKEQAENKHFAYRAERKELGEILRANAKRQQD